jgi:hypothetical protein
MNQTSKHPLLLASLLAAACAHAPQGQTPPRDATPTPSAPVNVTLTACDQLKPSVGQAVICEGSNFYNRQTTGWDVFHTTDLSRSDFEGTSGASLRTLNYIVGAAVGVAPTIDTTHAFTGSSSAHFRALADDESKNADCTTPEGRFQGGVHESNIQYVPTEADGAEPGGIDLVSGYVGYAVRFHRNTNWASVWNFQKHIEVPKAVFYWQPGNGGTPSRQNPQTFILFNTAVGRVETSAAFSPDGGRILDDRWYYVQIQYKKTAPTIFRVTVNGEVVMDATPRANGFASLYVLTGFVNACTGYPGDRNFFDVEQWQDMLVHSQTNEIYAPTEVWLCPTNAFCGDTDTGIWQFLQHTSDTRFVIESFRRVGNGNTIPAGPAWLFVRNQKREISAGLQVQVS